MSYCVKPVRSLVSIIVLSLMVSSCMPDSLTKFREDKAKSKASAGANIAPPPEECDPNDTVNGGYCRDLDNLNYPNNGVIEVSFGTLGMSPPPNSSITPSLGSANNSNLYSSFVITPPLPSGITFDPSDGTIGGTPLQAWPKTIHNVLATHAYNFSTAVAQVELSVGTNLKDLTYNIPTCGEIQGLRMIIKVDNVGTLDVPQFTEQATGCLTTNINLSTIMGAKAIIRYINYDTKELLVELHNSSGSHRFEPGMSVDSNPNFINSKAIIEDVLLKFPKLSGIQNDLATKNGTVLIQGSTKWILAKAKLDFEVSPLAGELSFLEYSITPPIPSGTGLSFDTNTGNILWDGVTHPEPLERVDYEVTVKNTLGAFKTRNISFKIIDGQAPKDLTLTRQVLFEFNATEYPLSYLKENFFKSLIIASPIQNPGDIPKLARVRDVFGIDAKTYIEVDIISGTFGPNDSLDNSAIIGDNKAVIRKVIPHSFKLKLTGTHNITTEKITISNKSSAQNAQSDPDRVIAKVNLIKGDDIYISVINSGNIKIDDHIYLNNPINGLLNATNRKVGEIHASHIKGTLSTPNDFKMGSDIVHNTSSPTGPTGRGVINSKNGANVGITMTTGHFLDFSTVNNSNTHAGVDSGSIEDISSENMFTLYSGQEATLYMDLDSDDSTQISINPSLPNGLSLKTNDVTNLRIEGTPTSPIAKTLYTLSAKNETGVAELKFYLKVHNVFEVSEANPSIARHLHQAGIKNLAKGCFVTSDMISAGNNIIDCHLDAGELNINSTDIKFVSNTSPGICQYIRYSPYGYHNYEPKTTHRIQRIYDGTPDCLSDPISGKGTNNYPEDSVAQAIECYGNYSDIGGPNCDNGSIKTIIVSMIKDSNNNCNISSQISETSCGGSPQNCIDGPLKDQYPMLLNNSYNSRYFHSDAYTPSAASAINYNSIQSNPYATSNVYYANYTHKNMCASSDGYNYKSEAWYEMQMSKNYHGFPDPFKKINPYYRFECLNGTNDIIASINIKIRDWDKAFELLEISGNPHSIDDMAKLTHPFMDDPTHNTLDDLDDLGIYPEDPNDLLPNNFCSTAQNEGYFSVSTSIGSFQINHPEIKVGGASYGKDPNILELNPAMPAGSPLSADDLLIVTKDDGKTASFFTVENVSSDKKQILVSRRYDSNQDKFQLGASVKLYRVPKEKRIQFPKN